MAELDTDTIKYEHDGYIACITLNRPEQLNALTVDVRADIARCLYDADDDDGIRAIIVTGPVTPFTLGWISIRSPWRTLTG